VKKSELNLIADEITRLKANLAKGDKTAQDALKRAEEFWKYSNQVITLVMSGWVESVYNDCDVTIRALRDELLRKVKEYEDRKDPDSGIKEVIRGMIDENRFSGHPYEFAEFCAEMRERYCLLANQLKWYGYYISLLIEGKKD
jgi:sugar-specific transcriptional regulator TrmB